MLLDGKIITGNVDGSNAGALAIREGRIVAVGSTEEIMPYIGCSDTRVIRLDGKAVIPGLIETHCHAIGVARNAVVTQYADLSSIAEIQRWLRRAAEDTPPDRWIRVPRTEITRIEERRFPTPAELDAACDTHPVAFKAVRHWVLNTRGWDRVGISRETESVQGGTLRRDEEGKPRIILAGDRFMRPYLPRPEVTQQQTLESLKNVLAIYNRVGITSIFERATDRAGYDLYRKLHEQGDLTLRVTTTFRRQFQDGPAVERYVGSLGLRPDDGDEWVKPGPLKITVDGGIHWGTTHLAEPYGRKRAEFYWRDNPAYRGDLRFGVKRMSRIFATAHRLGWQMSAHVTGDAGVAAVLDALEASSEQVPVRDKRFNLIHAYFPSPELARRAGRLGAGVDTQTYLYYRDADFINEIYGADWAKRFMAVGIWLRHGVPTAINSDHMIGLDPDHAMNAFNPFLQMSVAVTRKTDSGRIYGPRQRISRLDALRCMTTHAAWLSFDEDDRGSLEAGKLADLAVLDRNYLTCPAEEINDIRVELTIVGGRVVYER